MFQISTSPVRNTASALTVLAAMGASGMVAEAAVLEPTQAGYTRNKSTYAWMDGNWINWYTAQGATYVGYGQGYVTWDKAVMFASPIGEAKFTVNPQNTGNYGVQAGSTLTFSLITESWGDGTKAKNAANGQWNDPDGWDVGTAVGTETVNVIAPTITPDVNGKYLFDADITSIIQHWQANPNAYFGVRITSPVQYAGVYAPNDTGDGSGTMANLSVVGVPEPTALAALGLAGFLGLRRLRK